MTEAEKQQAIQAFENLKKAFQEVQKISEGTYDYVSFNYPFNDDDDMDAVVDKVEKWVDQTVYNLKNGFKSQ